MLLVDRLDADVGGVVDLPGRTGNDVLSPLDVQRLEVFVSVVERAVDVQPLGVGEDVDVGFHVVSLV